jgi:hypothetical protein
MKQPTTATFTKLLIDECYKSIARNMASGNYREAEQAGKVLKSLLDKKSK